MAIQLDTLKLDVTIRLNHFNHDSLALTLEDQEMINLVLLKSTRFNFKYLAVNNQPYQALKI